MTREERQVAATEAQKAFEEVCDLHILQEGDVVILRAPSFWTPEQCHDMAGYVKDMTDRRGLGIKFLMLPEDVTISVLRQEAVKLAE